MAGISRVLCLVFRHDWTYTDEYENAAGRTQADKVCRRCGTRTVAWTAPREESPPADS